MIPGIRCIEVKLPEFLEDAASQRLQAIAGIGSLTASAWVASVGDATVFTGTLDE